MNSMRLIDANALKKKAAMHGYSVRPLVTAYHMCVSVYDIDNAPTVEAEQVKQGEWLDVEYNPFWRAMLATCSSCGVRGRCDLREMSADLLSPIRLGAQTAAHICLREV